MVMLADPDTFITSRREQLLAEADGERLLALLPRRPSAARHGLALACYRLANWLDAPSRYVRVTESGPENWASPWLKA
jgi:hypothetical protein